MMKFQHIVMTFFSILLISTAAGAENSNTFPSDLMFEGKPIDSLCFYNLEGDTNLIHLDNCGIAKEKVFITGQNDKLFAKGYIGFNWKDLNSPAEGYSYYKFFPAGNHKYWVYTINNGGGSGDFTAINLVKRRNSNTLKILTLADGDRCNGGIQNVSETNHQLSFSVNLTAFDFLPLANANPHRLKAYDDLPACAVCCAAKAFYEASPSLELTLKYVDLGKHTNVKEMPQQGTYHECFNKLVASYVEQGDTKLDEMELKDFVKEFNDTCVK